MVQINLIFFFVGVGKTSLCVRYIENNFSPHVSPTIGASYFTCKIKIEDILVKLQVCSKTHSNDF